MRIDLNDEKTARVVFIGAVVVIGVLVAFGVSLLTGNDDGAQPEEPASPIPTSSEPAGGEDDDAAPDAAREVAGEALVAYTQYSYEDDGPMGWLGRLEPLATPSLVQSLKQAFGGGGDQDEWDRQVVAPKRETRTTVQSVTPSGMHENREGRWTFTVVYETAVRTAGGDWTQPAAPMSQFVTVSLTGDGWKVSNIVPTGNRESQAS